MTLSLHLRATKPKTEDEIEEERKRREKQKHHYPGARVVPVEDELTIEVRGLTCDVMALFKVVRENVKALGYEE